MIRSTRFFGVAMVICLCSNACVGATVTWQGGDAWWGGTNWNVDGTADQAHPDSVGDTTIIDQGTVWRSGGFASGGNRTWRLEGTGTFKISKPSGQKWDIWYDDIQIRDTAVFDVGYLVMKNAYTANNPTLINVEGGTVRVRNSNGFRASPNFGLLWFNLQGDPGTTTVQQMNNTNAGTTLTSKINAGYFRVDGVRVFGTGTDNALHGKYLEVTDVAGVQTATLEAMAPVGLGQTLFAADFDDWTATGPSASTMYLQDNNGASVGILADNRARDAASVLRVIDDGTGNNTLWMDGGGSDPDFSVSAHLTHSVDLAARPSVDFSTAVRRIVGPKNLGVYGLSPEGDVSFFLVLNEDDKSIMYKTSGSLTDIEGSSAGVIDLLPADIAIDFAGGADPGASDFWNVSDTYEPLKMTDFSLGLDTDGWSLSLTRYDAGDGSIVESYKTVPLPYLTPGVTEISEIRFIGQNNSGFFLDNLAVITAVPEPSSCILAVLGVCGIATILRRRRRR